MKNDNLNKKAIKASIWYTFGNILLKGCVFFTLPIFTRILSTSDFGVYNTYIAYEGLITAIIGMGLYSTVKNAKIDFQNSFDNYLSSILTVALMFLTIILVLGNIFYDYYGSILGFSRTITNLLILQSYGSFLIYFYAAKLNIEFKYKSYLIISFFNTIINILLSILLIKIVFTDERYIGRILGSAIPIIAIAIIITIVIMVKGKEFFNKNYWKYGLTIGLPLIPHVVSQSLLSQFDRIMINNITTSDYAGIYSYIYTICTIPFVICQSLDSSWTPWVYIKINNQKINEIRKTGTKYVLLFSLLTIGFICVMPEVTILIADKSYWAGIDLIVPLALANYFIFMYMLPVGIEYFNKKTSYISFGTVAAAIINILLNYYSINRWGYRSAAYTTLISYMMLYVFHRLISRKYNINDYYDFKKITIINIGTVFIGFLVLFSLQYSTISLMIRYSLIIIILLLLFSQKNTIVQAFKKGNGNEEDFKNIN